MTDATAYSLTPRARDALDYIRAYVGSNGIAPTYQQVGDALGLSSKASVARLLDQLEARGHIRRIPGRQQTIALVSTPTVALPADLHARLVADATLCGRTVEQHLADALDAYLPSPKTYVGRLTLRELAGGDRP